MGPILAGILATLTVFAGVWGFYRMCKEILLEVQEVKAKLNHKIELNCAAVKDSKGQEFFTNFLPNSFSVETRWKAVLCDCLIKEKAMQNQKFDTGGFLKKDELEKFTPDSERQLVHETENQKFFVFGIKYNGEILKGNQPNFVYKEKVTQFTTIK